jgi:hypothetical protein
MVVCDDDLQPECPRVRDLLDRGHATVHGQDQPKAFLGQACQCVAREAVALVEAARQVRRDLGAELAQDEHCQRGRADPVGVVVPVDADSLPGGDGTTDCLAGSFHVAEQERVVLGQLGREERPGAIRVRVAAPYQHRRQRLANAELAHESLHLVAWTLVAQLPILPLHGQSTVRRRPDGVF